MILKIKAFIYRFSNIFGLHIYLAKKEEDAFIKSLPDMSEMSEGCHRGLWQGVHGFTTVLTYRKPWYKALIFKIKHAFDFGSLND